MATKAQVPALPVRKPVLPSIGTMLVLAALVAAAGVFDYLLGRSGSESAENSRPLPAAAASVWAELDRSTLIEAGFTGRLGGSTS